MDKEDYPSDSDQSDEDFCPENAESDDHSEEESDGNCEESDDDQKISTNQKTQRNRRKHSRPQTKSEVVESKKVHQNDDNQNGGSNNDDEEEKKRSDALWADFLSDVNGSAEQNTPKPRQQSTASPSKTSSSSVPIRKVETPKEPEKVKVTEILEFAGEEIKITKDVPVNKIAANPANVSKVKPMLKESPILPKAPLKRPAGGLSSVLSSINKKNKISVLEKSKLDWDGFKQKEGLNEELQTFNKGRDGYLERQDFLERTDLRQFEIEKSLRQTKRSNR